MSKNQIVTQNTNLNEIQQIGEFGVNELMTMKETIGKDLSMPQFNLFMYQCNRMGLDPALKHAFPILYGGKMDVRVSYEGLLAIARKSDGFQGVHNQVVCENEVDDFEAETDDEGIVVSVKHKIRFPRGKAVAAYSIAKREGKKNVVVLMDISEVGKWVKKNPNFWKLDDGTVDPDMLKKHAGTRAIKGQFDIALAVEENMEEMNGGSSIPDYQTQQRKDITPNQEVISAPPTQPQQPQDEEAAKLKKVRKEVSDKFKKLGIAKEEQSGYVEKNVPGFKGTLADFIGLSSLLDMQIEMLEVQFDEDQLD
ncbi:recombinase RecT [Neobacillus niacini]|uniref:recombinase RecT n=1 Tax=Neobacillus niacini TaxID=86668 RepID=UPI002FFE6206